MGNCSEKQGDADQEPDGLFEREKWKQERRQERRNKAASHKKRAAGGVAPDGLAAPAAPPAPRPPPAQLRSYDEEAVDRMRHQLKTDADAFLLNNILLSIQFFENYEREIQHNKNNPTSDWDIQINEQMVHHNKHVFLADRLQETVHDHVRFKRSAAAAGQQCGRLEPLSPLRMFVIYDNIEASEPGDTSDYSAVLDAPFYKLLMEDTKEPGYVQLKKIEVLQNTSMEQEDNTCNKSNDSDFTESDKESISSDDTSRNASNKGEALLNKLKLRLEKDAIIKQSSSSVIMSKNNVKIHNEIANIRDVSGRRPSGPTKQISSIASKATLANINKIKSENIPLTEDRDDRKISGITKKDIELFNQLQELGNNGAKPKKSILKVSNKRPSGPAKQSRKETISASENKFIAEDNSVGEETESGYRSNSNSSPHNGSDSDYGYSTITRLTTPQPLTLSSNVNVTECTGIVSESCWTPVKVKATGNWSDDDDDDDDVYNEGVVKSDDGSTQNKNLYETNYYLNSISFMNNFIDIFMTNLGKPMGFASDYIKHAMTQGASIYCDTTKCNTVIGYEIVPAIIAAWPSTANEWIIRTRRTIRNPKTNFAYQWPTKYMVNKARGLGCLLVPIGYRPKRGINPDQEMQWRLIFPAAERYLESCLAHSQVRCYMFILTLVKTFMENETSKIGLDASHIKNHLFALCEDNYAMWPEDRLGETMRIFLKTLYAHFTQARFPDYFIENHDQFKNFPRNMLLKLQRKLADIIENPVMHMLSAIKHLKYVNNDFYPYFDYMRLYRILTTKNVLRLINPNIRFISQNKDENSSDSEDEYKDAHIGFWDKAKSKDKYYQWKKEQQRQVQARRREAIKADQKTVKIAAIRAQVIDTTITLPSKMDIERRRLVLDFFIKHFVLMAQHSEKFDATKQAIIYLEHCQRLTQLLREEPGGGESADEFMNSIRPKLNEYKLKLVSQSALKLPKRNDSVLIHNFTRTRPNLANVSRLRPEYTNINNQDSPPPPPSPHLNHFTFVDVHADNTPKLNQNGIVLRKESITDSEEDSKL